MSNENENPFAIEAARLHRLADSQSPMGDPHSKEMRSAFPLGTGRPGNASSRRTSRQSAKRIDRSVDNARKSIETRKRARAAEAKAKQFDAGMIDKHGGRTELGIVEDQKRLAKKIEAKKAVHSANEIIADWIRENKSAGDELFVAGGNSRITIKRLNKRTVTSSTGSKWSYNELCPTNEDGTRMTTKQIMAIVRSKNG